MTQKKRAKSPKSAPRRALPPPRLRKTKRAKPLRTLDATRGPGRPTKYDPEYTRIASVMVKGGATDFELAQAFGVTESTIYVWKARHPEFSEAIAGARSIPIERVERSLYHRAVGYSVKATKIVVVDGQVTAVDYIEHEPPDTNAASLWLRNVDPMRWRDRHEIPPEPDARTERELSDAEIDQRLEAIEQRRRDLAAIPGVAVHVPSKALVPTK